MCGCDQTTTKVSPATSQPQHPVPCPTTPTLYQCSVHAKAGSQSRASVGVEWSGMECQGHGTTTPCLPACSLPPRSEAERTLLTGLLWSGATFPGPKPPRPGALAPVPQIACSWPACRPHPTPAPAVQRAPLFAALPQAARRSSICRHCKIRPGPCPATAHLAQPCRCHGPGPTPCCSATGTHQRPHSSRHAAATPLPPPLLLPCPSSSSSFASAPPRHSSSPFSTTPRAPPR